MLVNNQKSDHLGRCDHQKSDAVNTEHIQVLPHSKYTKKQLFATTILKFGFAKLSVTISHV